MYKKEMSKDMGQNALWEEAMYLRVHQLQMGLLQFTDSTTSYRMLKEYGTDIRFIAPWKKRVVWNGTHWKTDSGALIHTKALEIVRSIYAEIHKTADYRSRLEIEKYAIQGESVRRRKAFVEGASFIPELNATVDDLDPNPWLLNVDNGTIDLRTGELLSHNQDDKITKIAKVK
jgi:putative DNA primase/helicase